MSGLSVHAVDVAAGRPAEGLHVRVLRIEAGRHLVAEGRLGPDGGLAHPITGTRLACGTYEVAFEIGAYLDQGSDGFIDVASVQFRITDPDVHCHLPIKFTAFGYAVFRGC